MIPLKNQALRHLVSKLRPGVRRKGTGWVHSEVVDEAVREGLVEPSTNSQGEREVRLTLHGIAERALMGPHGTRGVHER